jgi:hypothetical protein
MRMVRADLVRLQAVRGRLMADVVIVAAAHECHLARCQFKRRPRVVEPQPRPPLNDGMHG